MLQKACEKVGGASELASCIGASPQAVSNWANRGIPEDVCPAIERATGVTCEELRPDIVWLRMADKSWPWHPKGRPLKDVDRTAEKKKVA